MVILYWDIGREILVRQDKEGWGAKTIDLLSVDLRAAFPDMKGFSPRDLKYMRAFAVAWPERAIVQDALAQIPWYQNIALIEDWMETAKDWKSVGFKTPPVMITVANRNGRPC